MKTIALTIAAGAMMLPLAAMPAAAAELPRAAAVTPAPYAGIAARSLPVTEVAEHDGRKHRRLYDSRGRYVEPRRLSRNDRVWRGDDGRWRCRRDNGTTGLLIGAGVGALAGRAVDTRGDRSLGTILGAVGGGLIGREIDRGDIRCR